MLVSYLVWMATACLFLIVVGFLLLAVIVGCLVMDGIKRMNERAL